MAICLYQGRWKEQTTQKWHLPARDPLGYNVKQLVWLDRIIKKCGVKQRAEKKRNRNNRQGPSWRTTILQPSVFYNYSKNAHIIDIHISLRVLIHSSFICSPASIFVLVHRTSRLTNHWLSPLNAELEKNKDFFLCRLFKTS